MSRRSFLAHVFCFVGVCVSLRASAEETVPEPSVMGKIFSLSALTDLEVSQECFEAMADLRDRFASCVYTGMGSPVDHPLTQEESFCTSECADTLQTEVVSTRAVCHHDDKYTDVLPLIQELKTAFNAVCSHVDNILCYSYLLQLRQLNARTEKNSTVTHKEQQLICHPCVRNAIEAVSSFFFVESSFLARLHENMCHVNAKHNGTCFQGTMSAMREFLAGGSTHSLCHPCVEDFIGATLSPLQQSLLSPASLFGPPAADTCIFKRFAPLPLAGLFSL